MSPELTGVVTENRYADPRMWTDHYQELAYGEIGTGVAIGDYDNDGRPDLFVVSKTEPCRLFRNLGNWKFQDVTDRAGLAAPAGVWAQGLSWVKEKMTGDASSASDVEHWKQGATFVDVNNDGWLDLYVCRFGAPNLLFVNQHDGTFKEEAAARGLALNDASGMAAFCDYDRDGWLDVYIHTSMLDAAAHPNGQRDHLFHNNGDGTFTDVTEHAGIAGEAAGHSATWWDYDNDGWPDVYVANDYAPSDHLYHNNRDGTFTDGLDQVVPHTPYYSMGADLGDVNNDGLIDFFVADMAPTTHEKDQRGMAGSRARAQFEPADSTTAPQYMANTLFLGTGTGVCMEAAHLAGLSATDWTWSPRFEDLDNDGRLDLHATNGMTREYHNADLLDRIMSAESPAESRRSMRAAPALAEANLAFRNLGDLKFENVSAAWGLADKGVSFGSAFADLDGDGDLDLVYTNYLGSVTLMRNDSDSGHRLIVALRGRQSNRFGVGATVHIETASGVQVRQLVLARGVLSSSEPILHFGMGADATVKRLIVDWPSGHHQEFTDIAADVKLTITEPNGIVRPAPPSVRFPPLYEDVSESLKRRVVSTDTTRTSPKQALPLPLNPDRRGPALAIGDLQGDGSSDVVLGGTLQDPVRLLHRDPNGRFSTSNLPTVDDGMPAGSGPLLICDVDGDGRNDLVVTKVGTTHDVIQVLLNAGNGVLQPAVSELLPAVDLKVNTLTATDFDRDGRLDLFVGGGSLPNQYPLATRSALFVSRDGRFVDVTDSLAPGLLNVGLVTSALWSDVDGDGWLDLLIALDWGSVRYWHNNAGHGFEDRSDRAGFTAAGSGRWTALASADFNGDGRMDYVAGNLGLNTRYHATSEQPALLFRGDFGANTPLVIEGYYEGDRLFSWLTRNELGSLLPSVLKRFPRNDAYARATLGEILGEDRLASAKRFTAQELQSGVFLSQPDGTFRFEPLPRIAQIAPLQGIVAGDFNGDGKADIYAVQNSFAPNVSIGRFDGGLSQLLYGDGHGGFTAAAPAESGLIVRGDAKALAVTDLDDDGWPDFVISRHGSSTSAYRNHEIPRRQSFRVLLRGTAGNPQAIGARVTVELADGSTETSELQAGSGWWSQSSASLFFGYPDSNPPRKISIRWPTGVTTEHAFASGTMRFTQPAAAQ